MSRYIARRIPSPLAGAESCGPTQQWDPNFVFNGIKGQCTPKGSPMTKAPGFFESFMSAMTPKPAAAPSVSPYVVAPAAASGMSQNTMIAIGLGAVGLVGLLMLARK